MEPTTPSDTGSAKEGWSVFPLQIAALAGAYIASGWFGLEFASHNENATLIWPPTGICLAALVICGRRLWIGVWLGAFALSLLKGSPVSVCFGIAAGNTLMPVAGALLLVHFFDFRPTLERVRDVVALVFAGGALPATISAGIGVATLWLHGSLGASEISTVLSIWWAGDLGGIVAVAPLFLLLKSGRPAWRSLFRNVEFWSVLGTAFVLFAFAFSGILVYDQERIAIRLLFPLLFWAAIRLETRGAVLLNFVMMLVCAIATAQGLGPTTTVDANSDMGRLWLFLMVTGCTSMTLAAAINQRRVAEEQHRLAITEGMLSEREGMVARERESIMREMHDGIGGQLTSILSMVERGSATKDEISEALRRSLDDMRLMIDPFSASDVSFPKMLGRLRARLEPVLRRNGLRATWKIEGLEALDAFDPTQALHALRIIQEAVANVVQHAQATEVEIRIFASDPSAQTIAIEIADNGVGSKPGSTGGGHGIRNMNTRAKALHAELRIEIRDPGRSVSLLIPVSSLG